MDDQGNNSACATPYVTSKIPEIHILQLYIRSQNISCVHYGIDSNLIIHQGKTNSPKLSTASSRHIGPDKTKPDNETYSSVARTKGVTTERFFEYIIQHKCRKLELFQHQNKQHKERAHISLEAPRILEPMEYAQIAHMRTPNHSTLLRRRT